MASAKNIRGTRGQFISKSSVLGQAIITSSKPRFDSRRDLSVVLVENRGKRREKVTLIKV